MKKVLTTLALITSLAITSITSHVMAGEKPVTFTYSQLSKPNKLAQNEVSDLADFMSERVLTDLGNNFRVSPFAKSIRVSKILDYTYTLKGSKYYVSAFSVNHGSKASCEESKFVEKSCRFFINALTYQQDSKGVWKLIETSKSLPSGNEIYHVDNLRFLTVFDTAQNPIHVLARIYDEESSGGTAKLAEIFIKDGQNWDSAGTIILSSKSQLDCKEDPKYCHSYTSDMILNPTDAYPEIILKRQGTTIKYSEKEQDSIVSKVQDETYVNKVVPFRYVLKE